MFFRVINIKSWLRIMLGPELCFSTFKHHSNYFVFYLINDSSLRPIRTYFVYVITVLCLSHRYPVFKTMKHHTVQFSASNRTRRYRSRPSPWRRGINKNASITQHRSVCRWVCTYLAINGVGIGGTLMKSKVIRLLGYCLRIKLFVLT